MIVVPLMVSGETIGTLNIGRMGEEDAHFNLNEYELTKLFAGQASIAMQNAEAHGAVRVRAEQDALTGLRNHGSFQRELGEAVEKGAPFAVLMLDLDDFKSFNDALGHPAGDALLVDIARSMATATRDGDRLYRYGGDEFATILPGADRIVAHEVAERIRCVVRSRAEATAGLDADSRPVVTISAGLACFPDDGRTKDELVAVADRALYQVKPIDGRRHGRGASRDPYLRALDETALALLDHHDPDRLLDVIVGRAIALLGTPHGFLYLREPDGDEVEVRVGTGLFDGFLGRRMGIDEGLAAAWSRPGARSSIDDYDTWEGRSPTLPSGIFGSVVGVPLTSGGRTWSACWVSGRAAATRRWGSRDIDALTSFGKLASIALDNARLIDVAQRGALYDPTTGLPNRELLTDRIAHALAGHQAEDTESIAVVLLGPRPVQGHQRKPRPPMGDRLLVAVGQRLVRGVRPGDTVARVGGDEFGIIFDPVADADEARSIADRIVAELRAPFPLNDREWFVSASMGIALARPGRATPDELLREAEIAMVRAKGNIDPAPRVLRAIHERPDDGAGRARERPAFGARTGRAARPLPADRDARKHRDRRLRGARPLAAPDAWPGAAARLHPARRGDGPDRPVGEWVLETACRQAAKWRATRTDPDDTAALRVGQPLGARVHPRPTWSRTSRAILAATGLRRRPRSTSRSPRAS